MKFLLIQFYQTGDVVLTTHIPRELKKIQPDAKIDFLVFSGNRPVLINNKNINNIITLDKQSGISGMMSVIRQVRRNRYDAVLDFHNNPRSAYITFLSGARYKVGYCTSKRKFFYNTLPERLDGYPPYTKLSLIAPFTNDFRPESHDLRPEVFVSQKDKDRASEVLKSFGITDDDFIVTVSPTHKRATRRWNLKGFTDTAEYLTKKYGAKVILTYGPGELEYITENCGHLPDSVFIMPSLGLSEFCALLGCAKLHIGNDSAPHHIATAMNVPTFVILGSSSPSWVFPSDSHTWVSMGMECQPCFKSACRISEEIPCTKNLTFDMIKDRLDKFVTEQVKK